MSRGSLTWEECCRDTGLVSAENCVLVLIDFQERLLRTIAGKENIVDNAIKLLKFSKIVRVSGYFD